MSTWPIAESCRGRFVDRVIDALLRACHKRLEKVHDILPVSSALLRTGELWNLPRLIKSNEESSFLTRVLGRRR